MRLTNSTIIVIPATAICCFATLGDVALPAAFTDHMVLQRDRRAPISGIAQPNEQITVELLDSKGEIVRSGRAIASQGGRFTVELAPMVGSNDPLTLVVRGANTVTIKDVVVGDIWVAGGQSNMEWTLGATDGQSAEGVAVADQPSIRFLRAPHTTANRAAFTVDAAWRTLTPTSAPDMGAVDFWFALELHKASGVPIGILELNWGGTRAEPWTDLATLGADPLFTGRVTELRRSVDAWYSLSTADRDAAFKAELMKFQEAGTAWWSEVNATEPGVKGKWFSKDAPEDIAEWKSVNLPMRWSDDPVRKNVDGIEWYRRTIDIPAEWSGKECFVELGAVDDADILFVNGLPVANTIADVGASRRYRIPGSMVTSGPCTLALEVLDLHGEGGFMSPPEAMRMTCAGVKGVSVSLSGEWMARMGRSASGIPVPPQRTLKEVAPGTGSSDPASMFNAMIAPFGGVEVKGAIWYQGEANAGSIADAEAYRSLLPLTIRSWRAAFQQPDMPFGIVSLAAFRPYEPNEPIAGIWPILRDAQLATEQSSPNAGVITTIDIGDANDIHPRDKRTVGQRLARWAMAASYGQPETAWRGPRTKSVRRDADGIVIDFDVERGRLATRDGKPPASFAVAGADGVFVKADAELRPPNAIKIRSSTVALPIEVRYAWQDNPADANVVDEVSKLPAHPFRVRVEVDPTQTQQTTAP